MIKVQTDIITAADGLGLNLDTEVLVQFLRECRRGSQIYYVSMRLLHY